MWLTSFLPKRPNASSRERVRRELRERAQRATASGELQDAIEALTELSELEPTDPRWPHRLGDVLRRVERGPESISAYVSAAQRYERRGLERQAVAMQRLVAQLEHRYGAAPRRSLTPVHPMVYGTSM